MSHMPLALQQCLLAASGVSALVGTRVYHAGDVPASVASPTTGRIRDYVTYQRISSDPTDHQGGSDALTGARYQINCFSATPGGAIALRDAVETALRNQTGTVGTSGTQVNLRGAVLESDTDMPIAPTAAGEPGANQVVCDFMLYWKEV